MKPIEIITSQLLCFIRITLLYHCTKTRFVPKAIDSVGQLNSIPQQNNEDTSCNLSSKQRSN